MDAPKIRFHVLDLLRSDDNETLFTRGACHIFALELNALFKYPLKACRSASGGIPHCFAERSGEGIDARGSVLRKDFRVDFAFVVVEDITPPELEMYFFKLFPEEETAEIEAGKSLNQLLRERARSFIFSNIHRFGN